MEGFIIIQFNQVSKNYGATKALDSIDLTIEKGEIHTLIGENGAGKSTLIKILCGVVNKDSGDIYYEGKKYLTLGLTHFYKSEFRPLFRRCHCLII